MYKKRIILSTHWAIVFNETLLQRQNQFFYSVHFIRYWYAYIIIMIA